MQNLSKLFLYSSLATHVLCGINAYADTKNDQIDITNVAWIAGVDYRALDDYLQCMLQNPYASPDYLYQQLENISKFCGCLTGKQYHLPSMINAYDQEVKRLSKHHLKSNWVKSLQKYADKRDVVRSYHNYCMVDDDFDVQQDLIDVSNKGVFVFAHTDYDYESLKYDIDNNICSAPWLIEEVPPKITFGAVSWIAGRILATVASAELVVVAGVLQALGITMTVEYVASSYQNDWDARREKKQYGDIRQIDMKYN